VGEGKVVKETEKEKMRPEDKKRREEKEGTIAFSCLK
jgi:hypothetical protein